MTLDEFRRHPAYDYYIITLVSDCLVCDLETKNEFYFYLKTYSNE